MPLKFIICLGLLYLFPVVPVAAGLETNTSETNTSKTSTDRSNINHTDVPFENVYTGSSIKISDLVLYFEKNTKRLVQRVSNSGNAPAFVKVEVLEWLNQYEQNETLVPISSANFSELVVTPTKLVIPPGASRGVGLYLKQHPQEDKFYRVRFIPVIPKKKTGFDVSQKDQPSSGMSINIAWGSIVIIPRQNARYDTVAVEKDNQLKVINQGNSVIRIIKASLCQRGQCAPQADRRLLAGKTLSITVSDDQTFSAVVQEGSQKKYLKWDGKKLSLKS